MQAYWDTSCVLKLYCREADTEAWLDKLAQVASPPRSSAILELELQYAFLQKALRGESGGHDPEKLLTRFRQDVAQGLFLLYPPGEDISRECQRIARLCYAHSPPVLLRTLDGIHLATATHAACHELVTTDQRMLAAARLLGLQTPPVGA